MARPVLYGTADESQRIACNDWAQGGVMDHLVMFSVEIRTPESGEVRTNENTYAVLVCDALDCNWESRDFSNLSDMCDIADQHEHNN